MEKKNSTPKIIFQSILDLDLKISFMKFNFLFEFCQCHQKSFFDLYAVRWHEMFWEEILELTRKEKLFLVESKIEKKCTKIKNAILEKKAKTKITKVIVIFCKIYFLEQTCFLIW